MKQKIELRLQHLILLFTLPALLVITCVYAVVSYLSVRSIILEGFDRKLLAISTTTASFIDADEHLQIKSETEPLYRKYVAPMQRILQHSGLTYHYTLVPSDGNKIMYVLDAAQGEDHSFAGTFEENPVAESERLKQVMRTGQASLSDIQQFDIWGELKIATAPIVSASGEPVGLVGADVNISVINAKMSKEMVKMLALAALALLLSIWASLKLSRKFIEPIDQISQAALLICAADYDQQVAVPKPLELADLATALNRTSSTLRQASQQVQQDLLQLMQKSRRLRLIDQMQQFITNHNILMPNSLVKLSNSCELILCDKLHTAPSGYVLNESYIIAWVAESIDDQLARVRLKADFIFLAEKILECCADSKESLLAAISNLFTPTLSCLLLVDIAKSTVCVLTAFGGRQDFELSASAETTPNNLAAQLYELVTIQPGGSHVAR